MVNNFFDTVDFLSQQVYFTKGLMDLFTFGSGFVKGYYFSQGMEISPFVLDSLLVSGPLIARTGLGAISGIIEGIDEKVNKTSIVKTGSLGLGLGALELGLGYCVGYTIGGLSR